LKSAGRFSKDEDVVVPYDGATLTGFFTESSDRMSFFEVITMSSDERKTKAELIEELARLRRQAGRAKKLRRQLQELRADCSGFQARCDEQTRTLMDECRRRDRTEEALRLAEVIIAQSPAVLFRRMAGKKPTPVYVSSNISQFGYSAEDLLSGRIRFAQIVHPDDRDRLVEEIRRSAEADVEDYTQSYRILTRSARRAGPQDL
jgi:sigma-B regulation protein RsbU (phosphoserine phosphatase)